MVQKMVMYLGCALVFFATIKHCKGTSAYDPSTVINVYPSLQKIKNVANKRTSEDAYNDYDSDSDYDSLNEPGDLDPGDYPCASDSCGAASNVKPTWIPKNGENDSKKTGSASTSSAKLPDQEIYEETKMMKPAIKETYMKEEQNAGASAIENKLKQSLLSKLNGESPSKNRQLHDNLDSEWLKQRKWGSFQEMLQLLKSRKH